MFLLNSLIFYFIKTWSWSSLSNWTDPLRLRFKWIAWIRNILIWNWIISLIKPWSWYIIALIKRINSFKWLLLLVKSHLAWSMLHWVLEYVLCHFLHTPILYRFLFHVVVSRPRFLFIHHFFKWVIQIYLDFRLIRSSLKVGCFFPQIERRIRFLHYIVSHIVILSRSRIHQQFFVPCQVLILLCLWLEYWWTYIFFPQFLLISVIRTWTWNINEISFSYILRCNEHWWVVLELKLITDLIWRLNLITIERLLMKSGLICAWTWKESNIE
jgi:hypothetical protein